MHVATKWHGNEDPATRPQDPTHLAHCRLWPRRMFQNVLKDDQTEFAILEREMLQRADLSPKAEASAVIHGRRRNIHASGGKAEFPGCP
jgi:hypothetical protein